MTGACFPVYAGRHKGVGMPEWAFFIAKYFGSGVIIATAFIHVGTKSLPYSFTQLTLHSSSLQPVML